MQIDAQYEINKSTLMAGKGGPKTVCVCVWGGGGGGGGGGRNCNAQWSFWPDLLNLMVLNVQMWLLAVNRFA